MTTQQEADLRAAMQRSPMTYEQMADWVENLIGRRPSKSTLWMYKRGLESHSREGRRSSRQNVR